MVNRLAELSATITVLLMAIVAVVPLLTKLASELLLAFYRRSVVRSMRGGAAPQLPPAATAARAPGEPRAVDLDLQAADASLGDRQVTGGALYARWRRAVGETTKVYVAAGGVYAVIMAVACAWRFQLFSAPALVVLVLAFGWPAVMTAILIAVPARRWQVVTVVAYWILFFIGAAMQLPGDRTTWIVAGNLFASVGALVVRGRRIRAVAPVVAAFLTVLGVAIVSFLAVLTMVPGQETEMSGIAVVAVFVMFLAPVAGVIGGWRALRWLGRRYSEKRTTDQTITMAAVWISFAGVHGAIVAYDDSRWMATGLVAFGGFLLATTIGFRTVSRRAARGHVPRLLVLRVFALGRRSRRLFDRLAARWRHIGSVQLIAGPDLASSTVEPHEFFDFLSRKLAGRFLETAESIDSALAALDTRPDHDGRYRITDFFCRDTAWRLVFSRLAEDSDVVLMDLRGFSPANRGSTYELAELLNLVPCDRIAIVIDGATDGRFLAETIEHAASRISPSSPNAAGAMIRVRVFRSETNGLNPDRLLRVLCEMVAATQPGTLAPAGA
jgi:hypothetical protein